MKNFFFWGKQVGVNFNFTGEVGNSMSSLRLIEWVKQFGGDKVEVKKKEKLISKITKK